jgi:hypothetical protein
MDNDTRRQIANRMHLLLRRELGQGIDVVRTLAEPLYARDVLLVCDALPGSELASLALQFRAAEPPPAVKRPAADAGLPSRWPQDSAGFGTSLPAARDSDLPETSAIHPTAPRRWLSPSSWLGRA